MFIFKFHVKVSCILSRENIACTSSLFKNHNQEVGVGSMVLVSCLFMCLVVAVSCLIFFFLN